MVSVVASILAILVLLAVVLTVININQQATRGLLTRVKSITKLQCRRLLLLSILGMIISGWYDTARLIVVFNPWEVFARKQYAANSRGVQRSGLAGMCLLCSGAPACAKSAHDRAVRC